MSKDIVRFNGKVVAFFGVLMGVVLAVGLPTVILIFGHNLGVTIQTILIILAILGGATLGTVSAFFGIVIPSAVGNLSGIIPRGAKVKIIKENGQNVVDIDGGNACNEEDEPQTINVTTDGIAH
jgi:hypothetical protein